MLGVIVVAGLAVGLFLLFSIRSHPLYKGWSPSAAQSKVALVSPDALQIGAIFLSILTKYIPGTTGHSTRLIANSEGKGFDLQPVSLHGSIIITDKDIDRFNLAVSRKSDPSNNAQQLNPLFLVSFTTPLLLFALSNHSCPIRPLGAVNTRNRFEFEDALFCRDSKALLAASQSGSLSYSCQFGGDELPGRRRKRGVEFDIVVEVKKEARIVFRQYISVLQFLPSKHAPRFDQAVHADSKAAPSKEPAIDNESEASDLHMDLSDPHRWAASCKDYNPIHISSLAAKAFGFRSAIAHGNHAVALAAQQLFIDAAKSDKGNNWDTKGKYQLEVMFVKPMLLPAKLSVSWTSGNGHTQLRMTAKDTLFVTGDLTS